MARLICSSCGTTHQISIRQNGYRTLPCRGCGKPMVLAETLPDAGSTPIRAAVEATRVTPVPKSLPSTVLNRLLLTALALATVGFLYWLTRARVLVDAGPGP